MITDKLLSKNLDDEKREIELFINLANYNNSFCTQHSMELLRGITKQFMFLRGILFEDSHYVKCFVNDFLYTIYSISHQSLKLFYSNYRSMIENFIRWELELNDTDKTGVRNLFKSIKNKYTDKILAEYINYFDGEYGKCCDYVHSNKNANINIYEYYKEILEIPEITSVNIEMICDTILTFIKKINEFLLYTNTNIIETAYYRNSHKIEFYVGKKYYDKFTKLLS